jgi:hypothetical protein
MSSLFSLRSRDLQKPAEPPLVMERLPNLVVAAGELRSKRAPRSRS